MRLEPQHRKLSGLHPESKMAITPTIGSVSGTQFRTGARLRLQKPVPEGFFTDRFLDSS